MINRDTIIETMGTINKDGGTPETMALALVLSVLLDIRNQNEVIIEQSGGLKCGTTGVNENTQ
jgi:hypothetical protein